MSCAIDPFAGSGTTGRAAESLGLEFLGFRQDDGMSTATAVKERPILMQGQMVRATLADIKTQTRRNFCGYTPPVDCENDSSAVVEGGLCKWHLKGALATIAGEWTKCPYGQPGDRLWVRETICNDGDDSWFYSADLAYVDECPEIWHQRNCHKATIPSIFMPRWASRITLEIVSIRVERLQDITESDAIAEGIHQFGPNQFGLEGWSEYCETAIGAFRVLWESINGPGSWAANPWVWVVEFRRIKV